jgi:hypothetical protein
MEKYCMNTFQSNQIHGVMHHLGAAALKSIELLVPSRK